MIIAFVDLKDRHTNSKFLRDILDDKVWSPKVDAAFVSLIRLVRKREKYDNLLR